MVKNYHSFEIKQTPSCPINENIKPRKHLITVEPILLSLYITNAFADTLVTNTLATKMCMSKFGLDKELCTGTFNASMEEAVQPTVANILMTRTIIECIIPACLAFFVGPWSDKNGRKPFLMIPAIGFALNYLICALLAVFLKYISPWMFLLPSLASSLCGGYTALFICTYSYLADISTEKSRGLRITVAQSTVMAGNLLGNLFISQYFTIIGENREAFWFFSSSCICLLGFLYGYFHLQDSITNQGKKDPFFQLNHLKEMIQAGVKNRVNHGRCVYFLFATVICLNRSVIIGEGAVRYLALRAEFAMTLTSYSFFIFIQSSGIVIVSLIGIWLMKTITQRSEVYFLFIIIMLNVISSILVSLSKTVTMFMIFINMSCFSNLMLAVIRSEISKLVSQDELGKAFAFTSFIATMLPALVTPVYTYVYHKVMATHPFFVFFLSAGVWIVCFVLIVIVLMLRKIIGVPYNKF